MLTQMVDQLIQQNPTLLAQRTVDTRRYIMDQWNRGHREPIDENAPVVFLCDEAHSKPSPVFIPEAALINPYTMKEA